MKNILILFLLIIAILLPAADGTLIASGFIFKDGRYFFQDSWVGLFQASSSEPKPATDTLLTSQIVLDGTYAFTYSFSTDLSNLYIAAFPGTDTNLRIKGSILEKNGENFSFSVKAHSYRPSIYIIENSSYISLQTQTDVDTWYLY